jgi:hypothetical protein
MSRFTVFSSAMSFSLAISLAAHVARAAGEHMLLKVKLPAR